jgi:uncharacterized protein (TIGR03435 family)
VPAYDLVVVKTGKWDCRPREVCHGLKLSEDQNPEGSSLINEEGPRVFTTLAPHTTISEWAKAAATISTSRLVIDKTGLKGFYDIRLEYPGLLEPTSIEDYARIQQANSIQIKDRFPSTIQEQLGFKLEPSRAVVEVLFIDHVEKPSEN